MIQIYSSKHTYLESRLTTNKEKELLTQILNNVDWTARTGPKIQEKFLI